ncbi:hypothetical protein [Frankia sp. AgB32]|uniref:hypothetical protein n=1 Tax=Frankia sp. AgB32 TaxID=631119 RepID=UPI00200BAA38|nr:hypothetical protein [Frankia sp. AgB32]MCK9893893.1 hypothetical protein [Frankia sp. AgB32]
MDVTLIVEDDDIDDALTSTMRLRARPAVRTAALAIDAWTPGWNGQVREARILTDS